MKKQKRLLIITLSAALAVIVGMGSLLALATDELTDETEYLGSDLPVSESYVLRALRALDEKFTQKFDLLSNEFADVKLRVDGVIPPSETDTSDVTGDEDTTDITDTMTEEVTEEIKPANVEYEVLRLTKGQTITGCIEIVLRSGKATAHCPGANGLSDLTGGADLMDKTAITTNHMLLIPRDDGRGITVTSNEAYVMVRGTYQIIEPEA